MRYLEEQGLGRGTNLARAGGSHRGELLSGAEEPNSADSGEEKSPQQAGDPPPLGVKDMLKLSTDICLGKHQHALGEGTGSAAPWAPARFLRDSYAHTRL